MSADFFADCQIWLAKLNSHFFYNLLLTASILLVIHLLIWVIARVAQHRLAKKRAIWLQAIFYGIRLPTGVFIWVAGLTYSIFIETHSPITFLTTDFIVLSFILCVLWFVLRMINCVERAYVDEAYGKAKQERETIRVISRFVKVIAVILGILLILQNFGVSISGLVAFGGIGAAGIAFAARDILGNFFGGLMLFLNRPFYVGDWIRSPDRMIEGTVEEIGWLLTRIRTNDRRPLYVPNGVFSTIAIENPQRMLNRNINQTFGIRYQDAEKIPEITQQIKAMLQEHVEIDQRQTIIVDLVKLNSSSLDINVYAFTKTTDLVKFQDVQQDIFLKIIAILEQNNAECAFPTNTVYNYEGR